MNNIIECKLDSTYKEIYTGIWQHDYGQILRITGADLPKAVEVQFSLHEAGGGTITRIGTTVNGVTEVQIPDELLKNDGVARDYCIYAYVYVTDKKSGSTEYKIVLHVKSRPKPEEPTEEPLPEPNIFHETVEAVNASADRAENALKETKEIRDNLNLDLSEKITRPQTAEVGQVLAVKEIDESGKPTVLETVEMPTGSVSDIQINGDSIVGNSKIAEIPIASQGKPGVLGIPGETYGLGKDNTNNIRLIGLTDKEVGKRFYAKPLTGNALDYAVKSAMSAPIADTAGMIEGVYHYPAWTADEQKRARERMGVVSEDELELIAIIKPSADEIVGLCILDFSSQAIHENFYIIAEIGIVDKNEAASVLPQISLSVNGYKNWEYQELRKAAGELKYMIVHTAVTKSSGFVYLSTSLPLNNDFDSTTNMNGLGLGVSPYCNRNYMNGITKIEIGARNNYSKAYFSRGTIFKIYGKKVGK